MIRAGGRGGLRQKESGKCLSTGGTGMAIDDTKNMVTKLTGTMIIITKAIMKMTIILSQLKTGLIFSQKT